MLRIAIGCLAFAVAAESRAGPRPPDDGAHRIIAPKPKYPGSLLPSRNCGEVIVAFVVNPGGRAEQAQVVRTTHPDFVLPVHRILQEWRFEPALREGHPIASIWRETFSFHPGPGNLMIWATTPLQPSPCDRAFGFVPVTGPGVTTESSPEQGAEVLAAVHPVYPFELALVGATGSATVEFVADAQGTATEVKVISATEPRFGAALQAMVEASRFMAATSRGASVRSRLKREQVFSPAANYTSFNQETRRLLGMLKSSTPAVFEFSQLDAKPRTLYRPGPVYPPAEDMRRTVGAAEIEFFVDPNGRVQLPRVVTATSPDFGWAAATAVQQWLFEAPSKGGKPVFARARVPIEFAPRNAP